MVKKSIKKIFLILIIGLIFSIDTVSAANCDGIFTQEAYDLIREVLGYVTIAVPILLIILCATDLTTIVIAQDDSAAKKAGARIVKRFIAASAFFFVPLIVRFLLGLDSIKDSLNLVDDPLCGIVSDSTSNTNPGNGS